MFQAKLQRPTVGEDWTFLRLPQSASDQMPARSMVSVEGTLNEFPFAATLEPDSEGGHWLRVDSTLSKGANVSAGDWVELQFSPVLVEPEPIVPDDLRDALSKSMSAESVWNSTTAIARRDWITWMTQGKQVETRKVRLNKMIDMLSKGKKRVCCFDRSGMASKAFQCPIAVDDASQTIG